MEKISHPEMGDFFMACVRSVMAVTVHETPNMSFIVQTVKCLHYQLKGDVCLVQSRSCRCT